MEIPRVCESCGASHLFFYEPYQGRRLHSGVKEELHLGCRACKEPMMDWQDEDGDVWHLVLAEDPSVPALRERQRRIGRASRSRVHVDDDERPLPWALPGRFELRFPSLHPMVWVGLVCAAVALYVLWVALRG